MGLYPALQLFQLYFWRVFKINSFHFMIKQFTFHNGVSGSLFLSLNDEHHFFSLRTVYWFVCLCCVYVITQKRFIRFWGQVLNRIFDRVKDEIVPEFFNSVRETPEPNGSTIVPVQHIYISGNYFLVVLLGQYLFWR